MSFLYLAMTLYEFNLLDENDKYQTTWDFETHLDSIEVSGKRINLYAIDKFFVEVYYNPTTNKIVDIQSFKYGHSLEKYSGKINL